ncbi:MAG: acyl carrier protein [Rhodospirillales bacterium]|nr:acyl carrier protein [Rhodospirillales bacterium]
MIQAPLAACSVLGELTAILREVLDDPSVTITEATVAADVPGWDSMAHVALVVEIECRFGIRFRTTEIEALRRVGDLVRMIEAKRRR